MVLDDVRLKLLVATSNLSNDIVGFLLEMDLVDANQVKAALDVDNRNCDVQFLDQLFDLDIDFVVLSVVESDWRLVKQHMALFFDLIIRYTGVFCLRDDKMLIVCVLIDLLLSDSFNHLFLFHIEVS